jgi:hypothetical protein
MSHQQPQQQPQQETQEEKPRIIIAHATVLPSVSGRFAITRAISLMILTSLTSNAHSMLPPDRRTAKPTLARETLAKRRPSNVPDRPLASLWEVPGSNFTR